MLLEIDKLNLKFKTSKGIIHAIRDLSFNISPGETLGIVGESGCGKSITNLAIMGLLPDTAILEAETLKFEGRDLLSLKEKEWQKLRGGDIAMIFQDPMTALNPCFTVGYQIEETLALHRKDLTKSQRTEFAIDLLDQVGIPAPKERSLSYAHELSGGMSQRVMIAQAIACNPKLLIADEPTTALDVTIQDQILKLLKTIQEKNKMAMILVTHDLGVVAENADRIQVMYAGEVIETGPSKEIINHAHHPYTQGLLNSLPGKSNAGFRTPLPSIAGMVPDLRARPHGCQFNPRCLYVEDDCKERMPHLSNGKHGVSCYHPINIG
ncbi:peptide ABC transporter ATP-binding protein [Halobacteriovorax marinus]|uniref:Peptide ABC transporter ATP-binding protein n=1 Tax=Halobacteriovorax marinus TaxID=97084 RepID=A0A1Y5FCU9_9BACT|nr:peptide ABC transporter ATP-binding protein [Halobacteriovorax marinus]